LPKTTKKMHIVKVEPLIQHENVDVVHHLLVYICHENVTEFVGKADSCFYSKGPLQDAFNHCQTQVLSAWAKGGQSVTYPDDIGIPLDNPNGDQVVMIQMHYNNPDLKEGKVDSSGVRFWMTDKLRKIEGGQSTFGFPVSKFMQILPPKVQEFTNYAYCSAECTQSYPKDGINIIGGVLHTHLAGRKIRFLHFRNGKQLPNILVDNFYDFNYQDYRRSKQSVNILPGDELVLECVYETMNRDKTVFSGFATSDEMCLVYADYYPAVFNGLICYSAANITEKLLALNMTQGGDVEWTPEKVKILQRIERNGTHYVSCNKPPTGGKEDYLDTLQYGYPNVTEPLIEPDPCAAPHSGASDNKRVSFAVVISFIFAAIFRNL